MGEEKISLYDENGRIRSKEDFMKMAEQAYQQMSKDTSSSSFLWDLTDPENAIDIENVLTTFDFHDRQIHISEEITSEYASFIFELVRLWNSIDDMDEVPVEEREPIKVFINTPGGELEAVFSIIGTIKLSKTPVYTYTIGTGYSGGFFIGICGAKRYGFPYSSYCFHEGMTGDTGDAHKFLQRADFYHQQLGILKKITIDNTKITEEEYNRRIKDDWYMDAETALKYGVIDEIATEV